MKIEAARRLKSLFLFIMRMEVIYSSFVFSSSGIYICVCGAHKL